MLFTAVTGYDGDVPAPPAVPMAAEFSEHSIVCVSVRRARSTPVMANKQTDKRALNSINRRLDSDRYVDGDWSNAVLSCSPNCMLAITAQLTCARIERAERAGRTCFRVVCATALRPIICKTIYRQC